MCACTGLWPFITALRTSAGELDIRLRRVCAMRELFLPVALLLFARASGDSAIRLLPLFVCVRFAFFLEMDCFGSLNSR